MNILYATYDDATCTYDSAYSYDGTFFNDTVVYPPDAYTLTRLDLGEVGYPTPLQGKQSWDKFMANVPPWP